MEERKGENIIILDIQQQAIFAEYFVICSGTSNRMLDALADAAKDLVKANYRLKGRIEGNAHEGWILVDFGNVILHLFSPDRRDYYRLEELWSEGKTLLHLQ